MKNIFEQAINLTNSRLLFIPFLALIGFGNDLSDFTYLTIIMIFLWFVLAVVLYPMVYGRSVEEIKRSKKDTWRNLWETYWVDYILAKINFLILILLLSWSFSGHNAMLFIRCFTVYVFPMVFLSQKVLSSFLNGVMLVFQDSKLSYPLIILAGFTYAVHYIIDYCMNTLGIDSASSILLADYLKNIIIVYIDLIVFNAALIILVERKLWIDDKKKIEEKEFLTN